MTDQTTTAETHPLARLRADLREAIELALAGLPNKAIAIRTGCSVRTVERRRAEALRQLEVHTLVEAARLVGIGGTEEGLRPYCGGSVVDVAFRGAAVGLTVMAPDGRLVAANAGFCRISGYSEAELLGQGLCLVTHRDDMRASLENVGRLFAGEASRFRMRKRYIRRGGDSIVADVTVAVVCRPDGSPEYALGLIDPVDGDPAIA